jgi:hypothetical protein
MKENKQNKGIENSELAAGGGRKASWGEGSSCRPSIIQDPSEDGKSLNYGERHILFSTFPINSSQNMSPICLFHLFTFSLRGNINVID